MADPVSAAKQAKRWKTLFPELNAEARQLADEYVTSKNLPSLEHGVTPANVNKERAAQIAKAFEEKKHDPNDPAVKAAYDALIKETADQYKFLKSKGLKFTPMKPDMPNPYPTSEDMMKDLAENKHLYYFPTESGFGTDVKYGDHPLLQTVDIDGEKIPANDMFRIVHDYFGHGKEGYKFGSKGEENAWRQHMKMFSPEAQKALTTETRGQNSWVNFGPHGEANRANPNQTRYADQKAGLLPDWAYKTDLIGKSRTPSIKDLDLITGPVKKLYNAYDSGMSAIGKTAEGAVGEIADITRIPGVPEKQFEEAKGPVEAAAGLTAQMTLDPLNYVIPGGKTGSVASQVISRKEADVINKTIQQAIKEGRPFKDVLYETLKVVDEPYVGSFRDQRKAQELSDTITDLTGAATMDRLGMAENPDLGKFILQEHSKVLNVPEERMRIIDKYGKVINNPAKQVNAAFEQSHNWKRLHGAEPGMAEAAATKSGDPFGVAYNMNTISEENLTPHFMTGLIAHEAPHIIEAQKYGPIAPTKRRAYDFDLGFNRHQNLPSAYEAIREGHHVNEKSPIELRQLEELLQGKSPFENFEPVQFFDVGQGRSYSELANELNKTYKGREADLINDLKNLNPEMQKGLQPFLQSNVENAASQRFNTLKNKFNK